MKKYYKCALEKSDIDAVNRDHAGVAGVEIQLLDYKNDFSLMSEFKLPIYSIHMDLVRDKNCPYRDEAQGHRGWYGCYSVDLRENLLGFGPEGYFEEVLNLCDRYHARLVLHAQERIFSGTPEDEKIEDLICDLNRRHPELIILVENSVCNNVNPDTYSVSEIPDLCVRMNGIVGRIMFVPILDICHYYCEYAERIDHDYPSLAEIIRSYSLYGLNSHFSYAHGNGVGIYHGLNYDSNPDLCRNILRQITECDPGANLILEVNEKDYRNHINAKSLLKMIDTILYQGTDQCITKII